LTEFKILCDCCETELIREEYNAGHFYIRPCPKCTDDEILREYNKVNGECHCHISELTCPVHGHQ